MPEKIKPFKKIPNPPGKCIFCGSGSLTKEHIIAKWMRPFISDNGEGTEHLTAGFGFSNPGNGLDFRYFERGRLNLKGEHRSRSLRVVCGLCNNGWMGLIQEQVKPILQPMLEGKWRFLSHEDQLRLAAWAALYTSIWEQADQKTVSLHQPERDAFFQTGIPTANWKIWVGRNLDEGKGSLKTFHRALAATSTSESKEIVSACNFQMTTVSPGKTFFLTMSDNMNALGPFYWQRIEIYAASVGLRKIWPTVEGNILSDPFPSIGLRAKDTRTVIEQITSILNS